MLTWLTEARFLYAAPTQSSNNELIRRFLQIFFFSESTWPPFGVICGKTPTCQRVVPKTQYCRVRYTLNSLHLSSHKSYFYLNFRILSGTHNLCRLSLSSFPPVFVFMSSCFHSFNQILLYLILYCCIYVPVNSKTAHPPPPGNPRAFESR